MLWPVLAALAPEITMPCTTSVTAARRSPPPLLTGCLHASHVVPRGLKLTCVPVLLRRVTRDTLLGLTASPSWAANLSGTGHRRWAMVAETGSGAALAAGWMGAGSVWAQTPDQRPPTPRTWLGSARRAPWSARRPPTRSL